MKNITLIGMPGSGKSTIGVLLAKCLGYRFLDTDLLLQQEAGMLLPELLATQGLDRFLALEEQVILGVRPRETVVATGGSVVYGRKAMEHLRSQGTVVYLQIPLEEIQRRVSNIATRGIAAAPGRSLGDLYQEREPLYREHADLVYAWRQESLEESVARILELLGAPCGQRRP
ncbi:shikimate kinase [Anaerotalea alkaliphila]|uniref:Shikimate kinase n=1 Tax=Anaerotalea alkaliphila TaxID=2662126 RepID=A0A7X5KM49_9FIRM|nr:shikimate kinase [Anaerotalea alkaliphila]NDL66348.1 shikimate kinase [Anaerotalea alkaliphila]